MDSSESETLDLIDNAKRVFLLEPDYKRKYPPLGLMKIAGRVRRRGGKVAYGRNYLGERCDLICCTSLFTFESPVTRQALRQAAQLANGTPMLLGGVYATLMPAHALEGIEDKVNLFGGYSKTLDQEVPDYEYPWPVEEPWGDYSFTFTTRGCPNKCAYCAVPRIERAMWVNPTWREHIVSDKPGAVLCDNNLSSADGTHVDEVTAYLSKHRKYVIIDSGVEAKLITPDTARMFGRLQYARSGMRLAFDRIDEDGQFQAAIKLLQASGIPPGSFYVFVLFNFTDTPREADYRMRECMGLGITPYPQRYQQLKQATRQTYVGKHWTASLANKFRVFWLNNTHATGVRMRHGTFDAYLRRSIVPAEDREAWDMDKTQWEHRGWSSAYFKPGSRRSTEAAKQIARQARRMQIT